MSAVASRRWWRQRRTEFRRVVFGDRRGVGVFVGALLFFGLQWRIGFLVTDNYTVANALVAVADGHLQIIEFPYGAASGDTPGMHRVDGQLYGRNYGHVFLALPVLYAFEFLEVIVDLRIAIAGFYSLLIILLARIAGRGFTDNNRLTILGVIVSLGVFAVNVAFAVPLPSRWYPLMALQAASMVAGGLCGVLMYRLLASIHSARTGLFAGGVTVLASPVGFWAPIPKRHALTTMLVVLVVLAFAISRTADTDLTVLRARAVAYMAIGLLAWVHAAEALLVLFILVPLDLLAARKNNPRTLAYLGVAFGVSLLPFLLTNFLISGDPLSPPRVLPGFSGGGGRLGTTSGTTSGTIAGTTSTPGLVAPLIAVVNEATAVISFLTSDMAVGTTKVWSEPAAYWQTFIRSGGLAKAHANYQDAFNLTVVESLPIAGALTATIIALGTPLRSSLADVRRHVGTARGQIDVFVLALALGFTAFYMPRLPLHSQWTVRYLLPVFPAIIYGISRTRVVREVIEAEAALLLWVFAGVLLIGTQLLIVYIAVADLLLGEILQFHALIGLGTAGLLATWGLLSGLVSTRWRLRAGSIGLGMTAGVATMTTLLSALGYFRNANTYATALSDFLSQAIYGAVF